MKAIYAGSFDPFTFGHLAVAKEAKRLFGDVIILVGENPSKKGLFPVPKRKEIIAKTVGDGYGIDSWAGLLVDYASKKAGGEDVVLVRGLRMVSDFESEMTIAAANRRLSQKVSTVFIPTLPDVAFVSSSVVKEIARLTRRKRSLLPYVPASVAHDLLEALQGGRTDFLDSLEDSSLLSDD